MNPTPTDSGRQLAELAVLKKTRLRRRLLIPLAILALPILVLVVAVIIRPAPEEKPAENKTLLVTAESVERLDLHMMVESQGSVAAHTETQLVAEVSGTVVAVAPEFLAGGFFRRGEVLLEIDPSDYEVALKRAESTLAANQATLASEQARAEQARHDWDKLEGRRGTQAPDLVLRKPQLAQARAAVQYAEADVAKARRDLERTRIRAPYDALARSKLANIGQYVNVGTALGQIAAVDYSEVRLPVTNEDMAYLRPDGEVLDGSVEIPVTLTAVVGQKVLSWSAHVVRAEGVIDARTRMQYLVARVEDPYGKIADDGRVPLQIGQFVKARIQGIEANNIVSIPRHLLRDDDTVLMTDSSRTLQIVPVEVMREDVEFAYLSDGIDDESLLITTGIDFPVAGMALRLRDDEKTVASESSAGSPVELVAEGNN